MIANPAGRLAESLSYTLHALKGQKLLAQGNTLGNDGRKPVALKGQKLCRYLNIDL